MHGITLSNYKTKQTARTGEHNITLCRNCSHACTSMTHYSDKNNYRLICTAIQIHLSISKCPFQITKCPLSPSPRTYSQRRSQSKFPILPPLRLKLEIQILAPQIIRVHIYFTLLHSPLSLSLSPPL